MIKDINRWKLCRMKIYTEDTMGIKKIPGRFQDLNFGLRKKQGQ